MKLSIEFEIDNLEESADELFIIPHSSILKKNYKMIKVTINKENYKMIKVTMNKDEINRIREIQKKEMKLELIEFKKGMGL
jgi:hypothetical protein